MTIGAGTTSLNVTVDDGVVLHVDSLGEGFPVVLIHGFTGDASTMSGLSSALASSRLVIVPELVGHGRSSIPDHLGAYGVGQMAAHVSTLCQQLGHGEFDLVGYSMGGRVALTLACTEPHRVRSLALIGASAGLADPGERAQRMSDDLALADRIERHGLVEFVDGWLGKPLFASQNRLGANHMAEARAQRLANDPHGLAMSLRGGGTGSMEPLHDRLADCEVSTLLVVGDDDTKFSAIAASIDAAMPDSMVASIADSGHAAHVEQPTAVAQAIEAHISGVEHR